MSNSSCESVDIDAIQWSLIGGGAIDGLLASGLLDAVGMRVSVISPDLRYLYVNAELATHFCTTPDQLQGRRIRDVWCESAEVRFHEAGFARALSGQAVRRLGWLVDESGARRLVNEMLQPFRGADGIVTAIVVFVRDDTQMDRHRIEMSARVRELQSSEARKSAVFDHSLNALVTCDDAGLIVEFNPSAEAMFCRQRDEVLGQPVAKVLIPERYRAAHDAGLARLRAAGESRVLGRRVHLDAMKPDGSEFPIEMAMWRSDLEERTFYTASIVDLTEHHNAAQQRDLLRRNEKLTAMGALLAGVAHELNNPLAIVMGRASLLEEKCKDPDLVGDAQRIREATERCGRIVRTFLSMARGTPAKRALAQINDFVRCGVDMLRYTINSHGIQLDQALAPDLPPVFVDPEQTAQLVVNLLATAQQSLDGAAEHRRIGLRTGVKTLADGRKEVWLQVSDTGPGIPPDQLATIFDPFVTTRGEAIGSGLVLPVSRSLARAQGGDLSIEESGPGGTTMCFRVPGAVGASVGEIGKVSATRISGPLPRVLLVDDEPELIGVMSEMLAGAGCEIVCADSAARALELVETESFDALVSDFRMPGMDGAAMWQQLRRRRPELAARTLFVTGDTLSPSSRDFLAASRCASLDKPFTRARLVAAVKTLLDVNDTRNDLSSAGAGLP